MISRSKKSRRIHFMCYLEPKQAAELAALSKATGTPQAALLRRALDALLGQVK